MLGYAPIAPLLFHYVDQISPLSYETWMAVDLKLLSQCDIVLRLPGESPGAEREIRYARERDIPRIYDAHVGPIDCVNLISAHMRAIVEASR
jgi:hypothetical protein